MADYTGTVGAPVASAREDCDQHSFRYWVVSQLHFTNGNPQLLAMLDRLAFVNGEKETSEEESPDQKESRSQGLCADGLGCCREVYGVKLRHHDFIND